MQMYVCPAQKQVAGADFKIVCMVANKGQKTGQIQRNDYHGQWHYNQTFWKSKHGHKHIKIVDAHEFYNQ